MSWFKADDRLHAHPKLIKAGFEAMGLWIAVGTYCANYLTDGRVTRDEVNRITGSNRATTRMTSALVRAGFFLELDGGWLMKDYLDYNPSREQVLVIREKKVEAGKVGGQASAQARAQASASTKVEHPSRPDPYQEETNPPSPQGGGDGSSEASTEEKPKANAGPGKPFAADVDAVHAHFLAARRKFNPRSRTIELSDKDRKGLIAAFKRGFTAKDMKAACDGMFLSPFHCGENDRNTRYLDFCYVLKNVEKFIELAETAPLNDADHIDGLKIFRLPNRAELIAEQASSLPDFTGMFGPVDR